MKYKITLLIGAILFFASCDEDTVSIDSEAPVITMTSPLFSGGGEVFSGDTIYINVDITDNDELHEVALSLTRSFMNDVVPAAEVFHRHYHPDAPTLIIDEIYVIDTANLSNFWLYIEADDHNGNGSKDSVRVHVNS